VYKQIKIKNTQAWIPATITSRMLITTTTANAAECPIKPNPPTPNKNHTPIVKNFNIQ
jgi:hypothetical protein